jgi:hypothetical protein
MRLDKVPHRRQGRNAKVFCHCGVHRRIVWPWPLCHQCDVGAVTLTHLTCLCRGVLCGAVWRHAPTAHKRAHNAYKGTPTRFIAINCASEKLLLSKYVRTRQYDLDFCVEFVSSGACASAQQRSNPQWLKETFTRFALSLSYCSCISQRLGFARGTQPRALACMTRGATCRPSWGPCRGAGGRCLGCAVGGLAGVESLGRVERGGAKEAESLVTRNSELCHDHVPWCRVGRVALR